jgi:hypothetical protein
MVKRAGKASDEYPVMAQDLNQSFLGLLFGYNGDGVTIYGKLAACQVSDDAVDIWLDGASGESDVKHLKLSPREHLHFARTSGDWQLRETLEKLVTVIEERFPVAP